MKGISLPVNMVVIIAVAVLVLVALAAFFVGGTMPGMTTMTHTTAFNLGCSDAKAQGCTLALFGIDENGKKDLTNVMKISGYDPYGTGESASILDACNMAYGITDSYACRDKCCGTGTE